MQHIDVRIAVSTRYSPDFPRSLLKSLLAIQARLDQTALMTERPLHSTTWVRMDPPGIRREHATPADTNGELDWDKVTKLGWRPAWAIRSRRGALAPFLDLFRRRRG